MRILHLISSSGLFGAERVVIELSKGLKQICNCESIVGVIKNLHNPHTEIADEAHACDIRYIVFDCKGQFDLSLIRSIKKFVKDNNVDIIHCHGYKSNIYGLLAARNNIPTIATNHNWLKSHWRLKVYCFLDGIWIRYFDRIVAVSEDVKKDMLGYRIPEEKIEIIDNGIDLSRFDGNITAENIRKEFGINGNLKVIGTIGNLEYEKGHEYLFSAAREIIENGLPIKLLIVGDGIRRKELEDLATALCIRDSIIFTGYRKDIPELLSAMDIFVLPSVKEGLPMVLLEAMASKKPVIATKVGAIPNVIRSGENGLLCEPVNFADLRKAITTLLSDVKKSQQLAVNGYLSVKEKYSSERMGRSYQRLYQDMTLGRMNT